jgi:hypothetical protein
MSQLNYKSVIDLRLMSQLNCKNATDLRLMSQLNCKSATDLRHMLKRKRRSGWGHKKTGTGKRPTFF